MSSNNLPDDLDIADGALTELKSQYNSLVEDIKNKHREQQKLFQDMAGKKYDGEDYEQDRINHLIEANVSKLREQRDKIWKYLSGKYNQNTQQVFRNLKSIKNNEMIIKEKFEEQEELSRQVSDLTKQNSTKQKIIQNNMYKHKEVHNKAYVQLLIMFTLIIDIIVLNLFQNGKLSQYAMLLIVGVSGIIILFYSVYRLYIHRMNRDLQYWHKTYFEKIENDTPIVEEEEKVVQSVDYEKLDKDAKTLFSQYKDSCQTK